MNLDKGSQDDFRGKIRVHILFRDDVAQSVIFRDNGCGMDRDDLKSYATYSYSTEARQRDAGNARRRSVLTRACTRSRVCRQRMAESG